MITQRAAELKRAVHSISRTKAVGAPNALALCLVPDAMFDAEPKQASCSARSSVVVANVGASEHTAAGDMRVSVVVGGDSCGADNGIVARAQRDIEGGVSSSQHSMGTGSCSGMAALAGRLTADGVASPFGDASVVTVVATWSISFFCSWSHDTWREARQAAALAAPQPPWLSYVARKIGWTWGSHGVRRHGIISICVAKEAVRAMAQALVRTGATARVVCR
jgi:hypothetical protein